MEDLHEALRTLANEAGATHAAIVEAVGLTVHESVRQNCLVNYCGKSNRNWTCPPHTGELDVLGARLRTYAVGVLVQNVTRLQDSWDFEGMTKAAHDHNLMIRAIAKEIVAHFPDLEVLPLGCGGCDFCELCTCPSAPCRFPQEAMASVEAQGLDIKALVESAGLSYINGANTVSYVGMVMVRPREWEP
jgi:predicted metal-binding protein